MPAISGWKKLIGICMKDKITLSWISRNRSTSLAISIFSFLNRLSHHLNLEIIINLDDDDEKSIVEVSKITEVIEKLYPNIELKTIVTPRNGYAGIWINQNLIAKEYTGECLLIVNDDHFCDTIGWDEILRKSLSNDKPLLMWLGADGKPHPDLLAVNKKWTNVSGGVISYKQASDIFLLNISRQCGINVIRPAISIIHLQRKLKRIKDDGLINQNYRTESSVLSSGDYEKNVSDLINKFKGHQNGA